MDTKERRALDRCFEALLHDLDPSPSFLQALYAENILTEDLVDRISRITSRETQVATLLRYLPHRGPTAFSVFREKLAKDYPWLSEKLKDELRKLQTSQSSINKKLVGTIHTKLVPLVYAESSNFEMCPENAHPNDIIAKLNDLLIALELKCHKSLDVLSGGSCKVPIHKLIEQRLQQEKKKVVDNNLEDLSREVKELKKQLRDVVKLKGDNERLKNTVERQKEKLKDYTKMTRDSKKHKQEMEKYKKESEMLRYEIETLREQLRGNITNMFA